MRVRYFDFLESPPWSGNLKQNANSVILKILKSVYKDTLAQNLMLL